MGDRVVVRFKNAPHGITPPEVYLHWAGSRVGEIIEKAAPVMRHGDPTYQIARFIGVCHVATGGTEVRINGGPLGMGVAQDGYHGDQGDAGQVFIDLQTGKITHEGGHYRPELPESVKFGRF